MLYNKIKNVQRFDNANSNILHYIQFIGNFSWIATTSTQIYHDSVIKTRNDF